jgi:tmRNA-binding protein
MADAKNRKEKRRIIVQNRKARHDYFRRGNI